MQPVDKNRPGFQPLGCGSICTQGFALGWYRSAPLALEAIRRVWIFGERPNFGFFLKLTHYRQLRLPTPCFFYIPIRSDCFSAPGLAWRIFSATLFACVN